MFERIANRQLLEEFKEQTQDEDNFRAVHEAARARFELLGTGGEAVVYQVGNGRVLKLSQYQTNLRAEYIIFIDPQYAFVTPQAYDHHGDWYWITVERIDPIGIGAWDTIWNYLPEFDHLAEKLPRNQTGNFLDGIHALQRGTPYEWLDDLPSREFRFFRQLADLHSDLGLKARDIKPSNFGMDDEGKLVLYDIFTRMS